VVSAVLNPGKFYPMSPEIRMVIDLSQPDATIAWQVINQGHGQIIQGRDGFYLTSALPNQAWHCLGSKVLTA